MRLGIYSDLAYRSDGETLSTHQAFIRFVTSLPPRVTEVVLFGRLDPEPGSSQYAVPTRGVRFVSLPYYPKVTAIGGQLRALRRSCAVFAAELDNLDAVWVFGPHPMALVFAWVTRRHGKPLFLGVRQDYPQYIANRLPSRRWFWAVPVAHVLDRAFRALARRAPTVALGDELARRYRRPGGAPVLTTGFSLVKRSDVVASETTLAKRWDGELHVLSVGRLDPEKNPLLLPQILFGLRARNPRWRLSVAGDGPSRAPLERRVAELGLQDAMELLGDVPNGPRLWQTYRSSHAFLHVSLTEGLPQVLFEAQAAGLPVVATAVGGVSGALGGGESGVLIRPDDAGAAIAALERVAEDEGLRGRLIAAGLENAKRETLEGQLDRLAAFFSAHVDPRAPRAPTSPTGTSSGRS